MDHLGRTCNRHVAILVAISVSRIDIARMVVHCVVCSCALHSHQVVVALLLLWCYCILVWPSQLLAVISRSYNALRAHIHDPVPIRITVTAIIISSCCIVAVSHCLQPVCWITFLTPRMPLWPDWLMKWLPRPLRCQLVFVDHAL